MFQFSFHFGNYIDLRTDIKFYSVTVRLERPDSENGKNNQIVFVPYTIRRGYSNYAEHIPEHDGAMIFTIGNLSVKSTKTGIMFLFVYAIKRCGYYNFREFY